MSKSAARTSPIANDSRDGLIVDHRGYVHSIVNRLIAAMGLPLGMFDEFVSAGYLGLVEAAERYNPSIGTPFKPFAFLRIRGAIIDSIRDSSHLSGKAYRMAKALSAVQDMRETGLLTSVSREGGAERLLDIVSQGALAYRLSMGDAEQEAACVVSGESGAQERLEKMEDKTIFRKLIATLPQRERLIIEGYYFQERPFVEIANENKRMSKSWVSRIHARALRMLRDRYLAVTSEDLSLCTAPSSPVLVQGTHRSRSKRKRRKPAVDKVE